MRVRTVRVSKKRNRREACREFSRRSMSRHWCSWPFPALRHRHGPSLPVAVGMDHYRGRLEIGRTPMWLTDGCVAGYSTYRPGKKWGEIAVEDGCHVDTPKGRLKTVEERAVSSISDRPTLKCGFAIRFSSRSITGCSTSRRTNHGSSAQIRA